MILTGENRREPWWYDTDRGNRRKLWWYDTDRGKQEGALVVGCS